MRMIQIYTNFFSKIYKLFLWISDIKEIYIKLFTNIIKLFTNFRKKKFTARMRTEYLDYTMAMADEFGGTSWAINEFSWDIKYAGLQILAAKVYTDTSLLV